MLSKRTSFPFPMSFLMCTTENRINFFTMRFWRVIRSVICLLLISVTWLRLEPSLIVYFPRTRAISIVNYISYQSIHNLWSFSEFLLNQYAIYFDPLIALDSYLSNAFCKSDETNDMMCRWEEMQSKRIIHHALVVALSSFTLSQKKERETLARAKILWPLCSSSQSANFTRERRNQSECTQRIDENFSPIYSSGTSSINRQEKWIERDGENIRMKSDKWLSRKSDQRNQMNNHWTSFYRW